MTQKQDYAQRLLQKADTLETRAQIIRRVVANCNDETSDEVRRLILNNERKCIKAELTLKAVELEYFYHLKKDDIRWAINTFSMYHKGDKLASMVSSYFERSREKEGFVHEDDAYDVAEKLLTRKIATQEEYDGYIEEYLKNIHRLYEPRCTRCPSSFW